MKIIMTIASLVIYFAGLLVTFARWGLNILSISPVAGIAIFIIWTAILMTVLFGLIWKNKPDVLPTMLEAKPKTKAEELENAVRTLLGALNHAEKYGMSNPFRNAELLSSIEHGAKGICEKYANVSKLLKDSFSTEDLTYITYTDTLDEVADIAISNMKAIIKRIQVFDYRGYQSNPDRPIYAEYVEEVGSAAEHNALIDEKLDNLTHELVRLDDVSDVSLTELTDLIAQTKQYK